MIVEASITGFFKTVLILIGVFVALRFIGRLMIAKRNLDEEREMLRKEKDFHRERNDKLRNFGKVTVSGKRNRSSDVQAEDVEFEEVKG